MSPKLSILTAMMAILFTGCTYQLPIYRPIPPKPQPKVKPKPKITPAKPTKVKELKEVQDHNFDPEYMYPDAPKRTPKTPIDTKSNTSADTMSKEECIGMIGQAKFDKYTQMLGNESAAIKRCTLLRSMK